MSVTVLCVGKIKESFFRDACSEYQKRLNRLMNLQIVEVPDEPEPEHSSDAIRDAIVQKEGERLLSKIGPQDTVIALCIKAKQCSSEALAAHLRELMVSGRSRITFVIGGSLGLSAAVLARANEKLSVSEMTFPHQLFRVMLLEQLYRAAKINAGERYHK